MDKTRRKRVLRSPIKMIGGKGVLRGKILPYLPRHKVYVEPFGGGASVLLRKPRSEVEVYNDLDPRPVSVFACLKDTVGRKRLTEKLVLVPYSRAERLRAMENAIKQKSQVDMAWMYLVDSRQSLGGMLDRTSWGFVKDTTVKGMAQPIHAYIDIINMFPRIGERMKDVQLYNDKAISIMQMYDGLETLFYLDPPYPKDTRKDGWFQCEMTEEDHNELVKFVLTLKGMVVISGYPSPIYQPLVDAGWKFITFNRSCNSAARTKHTQLLGDGIVKKRQKRVECLWISPSAAKRTEEENHGEKPS